MNKRDYIWDRIQQMEKEEFESRLRKLGELSTKTLDDFVEAVRPVFNKKPENIRFEMTGSLPISNPGNIDPAGISQSFIRHHSFPTDVSKSVDHPSHYGGKDNPYEAIKVIEAWNLDFNLGNTVKYISRAGKKDKNKELEDLKKAQWYLNRAIQTLQKV